MIKTEDEKREAAYALFVEYFNEITLKGYKPYRAEKEHQHTELPHCAWMCREAISNNTVWPLDKTMRWLGFIQCILVINGFISVSQERDKTRSMFT